jgi:hypothetical protein
VVIRTGIVGLLAVAVVSACGSSSSDGDVAFAVQQGFAAHFPANTGDVLDLGVPQLHNVTNAETRLISVALVAPPPPVRLLSTSAYRYAQVGSGVISNLGDLPRRCPDKYVPHPVSAVTTPPNSDSAWFVVLALQASKPGSYQISRIRIDYESGGKRHWQYQNLDTQLIIKSGPAARFPASACLPGH